MPTNPAVSHIAFASHYRKRTTIAITMLAIGLVLLLAPWMMFKTGNLAMIWTGVAMLSMASAAIPAGTKLLWASLMGKSGEAKTLKALQNLPEGSVVVTNWVPPDGKGGDIDLMVVGSHGVLAVEIKRWFNPILIDGDTWRIQLERGYKKKVKSPSLQAKRNATTVTKHLSKHGVKVTVSPVVVLASRIGFDANNPTLPILRLHELPNHVKSLPPDPKAEPSRIVAALQGDGPKQLEPPHQTKPF